MFVFCGSGTSGRLRLVSEQITSLRYFGPRKLPALIELPDRDHCAFNDAIRIRLNAMRMLNFFIIDSFSD